MRQGISIAAKRTVEALSQQGLPERKQVFQAAIVEYMVSILRFGFEVDAGISRQRLHTSFHQIPLACTSCKRSF